MTIELTQRDLKEARESMKAQSREKCRSFLDGKSKPLSLAISNYENIAFYNCTKQNSFFLWNCHQRLIAANNCVKQ